MTLTPVTLPFQWVPDLADPPVFQQRTQQNFEAVSRAQSRLPWPSQPGDFKPGSFEQRLVDNLEASMTGATTLPWERLSDVDPPLDSFEARCQENMDRIARHLRNG